MLNVKLFLTHYTRYADKYLDWKRKRRGDQEYSKQDITHSSEDRVMGHGLRDKWMDQQYYEALGRIAAEFSFIEYSLMHDIQMLMTFDESSFDDRVMIMLSGDDFRSLTNKIDKLFRHCVSDESLRSKLKVLLKELNALYDKRSLYLHMHNWDPIGYPGGIGASKYKRAMDAAGEVVHTQTVTLDALNRLVDDAHAKWIELANLIAENLDVVKMQWKKKLKKLSRL